MSFFSTINAAAQASEDKLTRLKSFVEQRGLMHGHVVSLFIIKHGDNVAFKDKVSKYRPMAIKDGNKALLVNPELAEFVRSNGITVQDLDMYILDNFQYKEHEYSPVSVLTDLLEMGARLCTYFPKKIVPEGTLSPLQESYTPRVGIKFRGEEIIEPLVDGFPKCTPDFRDFLKRTLNVTTVRLYPYNAVVMRFTMFYLGIVKFVKDKSEGVKRATLRPARAVQSIIGVQPNMFEGNDWNRQIVQVMTGASDPSLVPEMELVLKHNGPVTAETFYKMFYNMITRNKEDYVGFVNFIKMRCAASIDLSSRFIGYWKNKGLIGALEYLKHRRTMLGEDKASASELTRHFEIGAGLPAPCSTANKWVKILGDLPETSNYVFAGCKPGHWFNVLKSNGNIKLAKKESKDEVTGQITEYIENAIFIDTSACTRNDEHTWQVGDVFTQNFKEDTMLISDAFTDKEHSHEFLMNTVKALCMYCAGKHYEDINKPVAYESVSKLKYFVFKVLIDFDKKQTLKNTSASAIPEPLRILFTMMQKLKVPIYITKIGRSHQNEVVLSNMPLPVKECVEITSLMVLQDWIADFASNIVDNNFSRMWAMYSLATLPVDKKMMKMSYEECPTIVTKIDPFLDVVDYDANTIKFDQVSFSEEFVSMDQSKSQSNAAFSLMRQESTPALAPPPVTPKVNSSIPPSQPVVQNNTNAKPPNPIMSGVKNLLTQNIEISDMENELYGLLE